MPTLTIRNIKLKTLKALRVVARRRRRSVFEQIEAGWARQPRRPTAAEVAAWIAGKRV